MISIRLDRRGTKLKPFYKIIAIDSRRKKGAPPLETLGYWHPAKNVLKIEKEKIDAWLKKGAKFTAAVRKLIK
jgi:small subunit ribosomal protein S16